nr:protachykinin [Syngnathus scovelli]
MEMLKLVLLFLLLTNVFCLNGDKHTSQIKSGKPDLIEDILTRMARKPPPPPRRFFKKNTAARSLAARKLHRFQTFVGLMGKRS